MHRPNDQIGYDDYLTSLTDRFNELDPAYHSPILNHIRALVDRTARGIITHIDDEKYVFDPETAFDENKLYLLRLSETKRATMHTDDAENAKDQRHASARAPLRRRAR